MRDVCCCVVRITQRPIWAARLTCFAEMHLRFCAPRASLASPLLWCVCRPAPAVLPSPLPSLALPRSATTTPPRHHIIARIQHNLCSLLQPPPPQTPSQLPAACRPGDVEASPSQRPCTPGGSSPATIGPSRRPASLETSTATTMAHSNLLQYESTRKWISGFSTH